MNLTYYEAGLHDIAQTAILSVIINSALHSRRDEGSETS